MSNNPPRPIKYYSTKKAANELGVCGATLLRWRKEGKLIPSMETVAGHARYSQEQIDEFKNRIGETK